MTKPTIIYHYTDSGDLVHCNMCNANMLVPRGADKCPKCYYEGALQWFDDGKKEATVSQLDLIPEYALVTKNNPEPTEYLSDEVLKEEFNMEPNPQHKYIDTDKENIVSSFFFYMWNSWRKEECQAAFGWEWEHFWNIWTHHAKDTARGATEKFYADLTTNNRAKLVSRACLVYNGDVRRKQ